MAYTNDVAALNPENWRDMLQEVLRKSLTAMEVADLKIDNDLKYGTKVHFPMFGELTTTAYVKGADVTVQALDTTDEYLTVDTSRESSFYLDDVDVKQNMYSAMSTGIERASYAIRSYVETAFYSEVLNAYDSFDAGDSGMGGSAGAAIALTTDNVFKVFSRAKAKLRSEGVDVSNIIAVVDSDVAAVIEEKALSSGFNVADGSFKNGYAGDFNGVKVYVSEFIDTTTNSRKHCYFGESKQIALAMQIAPTTQIDRDPMKFGSIVKMLTVFGKKTFTERGKRFLDLQVTVA